MVNDRRYASLTERLANIDALYADLADILKDRTSVEWLDAFDHANVPAMAVLSPKHLVNDAHLETIDFWHTCTDTELGTLRFAGIPTLFSDSPGAIRRMVPRLGEHTIEVLREVGIDQQRINTLVAQDGIYQAVMD